MIKTHSARILAWILLVVVAIAGAGGIRAQVVITEIMTDAAPPGDNGILGNDFIELTNFGAESVDLTGYGIHDDSGVIQTNAFTSLVMGAGEAVILVRAGNNSTIRNRDEFLNWWGADQLPADLQVRLYERPGLNPVQDELWLKDPEGNVVDFVLIRFGQVGRTLVHDPETGVFGVSSRPGFAGGFQAASNPADVGSPGFAPTPIPVRIVEHPQSVVLDGCGDVEFVVKAGGLPALKYQWHHRGEPLVGETGPVLRIRDAGLGHEGEYSVWVGNGLGDAHSRPATLTVRREPVAPYFRQIPRDALAFPGQTASLEVEARGNPCPDLQWYSDGQPLEGQTGRVLQFPLGMEGDAPTEHLLTVRASNPEGQATATIRIRVQSRPRLTITEIMAAPDKVVTSGHRGWFELTNEGADPVPLDQFRFRDVKDQAEAFPPGLFEAAFEFPPGAVIRPGESVVCVEDMTPEDFREWWGADRLPPGLQIFPWVGFGLSQTGDEALVLWNRFPSELFDSVATAEWLGLSNDGSDGVSEELESECDPAGCIGSFLRTSIRGVAGAFRAEKGDDVGSPGYRSNPEPRCVGATLDNGQLRLQWRVSLGRLYRLLGTSSIGASWSPMGNRQSAGDEILTLVVPVTATDPVRLFRLEELQ